MTVEVKPHWANWKPQPELTERDAGELFVRVFLPYSDIQWSSREKYLRDREAIERREIPTSIFETDEDYLAKDDHGNLLPGNITEEIYWAVHHNLPFWRLGHIRQLALLSNASEVGENRYAKGPPFSQTRHNHSFLTARPLEIGLKINNSPIEEINNGIIAALSHDIATPPYGDPTKELDPEFLDEEVAARRLFKKYDLSGLKKYGFDEEKVLDAIAGKGTLGKFLDIADKISYTAIDTYNYVGQAETFDTYQTYKGWEVEGSLDTTVEPMKNLIREDPLWADIYKEVRVDQEGNTFFIHPKRLSTLLEMRAIMHRALYLNPHCRGQDMLYKMLARPLYKREPDPNYPFNSENLLFLTDEETSRVILDSWQLTDHLNLDTLLGVLPDFVEAKDKKDVKRQTKKLANEGFLVIGSEKIRRFNPATDFKARDPKDGKLKPFHKINPEKAQELEDIASSCKKTVVYYWPKPWHDDSLEERLKPVIERITRESKIDN